MLFNRNKTPAVSQPVVETPVVETPVVASTPETPKAEFVPKEEFDQLKASIYQLQDNVTNFFMQQNRPQQSTPTPQIQIEDVSDEDYEKAIMGELDRRQASQIIQKRHAAIAKRENLALMQEVQQLKTVGMQSISNLTAQGLTSKPHYATYKKEIDAAINQLPPEARMNAEALNGVYQYVIGSHIDEILAAERETVLRQAAATPSTPTPTGRGLSGNSSTSTAPNPTEALDPLALAAIRDKYGSISPAAIEKFVKSQGQPDWDTYYTKYLKPFEMTEGNA